MKNHSSTSRLWRELATLVAIESSKRPPICEPESRPALYVNSPDMMRGPGRK